LPLLKFQSSYLYLHFSALSSLRLHNYSYSIAFSSLCTSQRVMGSGSLQSFVLRLDIRWRWVVNFTFRPFFQRENSPRKTSNRRLVGILSQSGRFGEY